MDIRKVKKLIELLEESDVAEIEIHEGEESVRISRCSSVSPTQTIVQVPDSGSFQTAGKKLPVTEPIDSAKTDEDTNETEGGSPIKSPM
ncbi:MAG: acetyl-CoA carboxylase biotin carboxyl carrier protein, partial [Gammaproteobacteria bacterium]